MVEIDATMFDKFVKQAIDNIPAQYGKRIANVAFVTEDMPSPEQHTKLRLGAHQSLYGLYEGIPLTKRGAGYNLVLPDKITIFRLPILASSATIQEAQERINNTVWHEVAHYFGLDHAQINKLESK